MPISIQFSASALGTKTLPVSTGQGGGANLAAANLFSPVDGAPVSSRTMTRPASSTADYYHTDGLSDFRPWDLTAWGSHGAAIATAKGYRYVWLIAFDHYSGTGADSGWGYDGWQIYAGFSNDPHTPPEPSTLRAVVPYNFTIPGESGVFGGFQAWPVYNPDDSSNPFYLYIEGGRQGGALANSLPMVVLKNSGFDTEFTPVTISHPTTTGFGMTAYQRVYRLGTGDWISFGGGDPANNGGLVSKWTSTNGILFTNGALYKTQVNSSGVAVTGAVANGWLKSFSSMCERFQIGSDWYLAYREDLRGPGWSSGTTYAVNEQVNVAQVTYKSLSGSNTNNPPATSPGQWQNLGYLGMYVTLVPIDGTTGDINITGTPPMIRVSDVYSGLYPDATYLQYVTNCVENGIVTVYAVHGFFADTGLVFGAFPEQGGGINEQYVDIYAYVFDAIAARASAPLNVRASCSAGIVTLTWNDIPAGRTYRVKRGTVFGTYGTTLGDVTGSVTTDSPTVGLVYYYQVTSLFGGVEQASRVVSTYVS
jgi:hypothetical protein